MNPLRVLVVDDSVVHRQTIAELLKGAPDIEIVGKAANGEEALRMAAIVNPDLITLDLEMPRMDGFTFLRILMAKQPTPVIVISSQAHRENVFKALELGALDFVARPGGPGELVLVRDELLSKVGVVRHLRPAVRPAPLRPTTGGFSPNQAATAGGPLRSLTPATPVAPIRPPTPTAPRTPPRKLVVIASSTGGPQAILELVGRLPAANPHAFIVAQHMPERFTRTFAERLNRRATMRVGEGEDGSLVEAASFWICPGGKSTDIDLDPSGLPRFRVGPPDPSDRYVPSADRLFRGAAAAYGNRVLAIVLTGMGDDGSVGLAAVKKAGGEVWVESAESAIVDGMPASARRTRFVDQVLALPALINRLSSLQA